MYESKWDMIRGLTYLIEDEDTKWMDRILLRKVRRAIEEAD